MIVDFEEKHEKIALTGLPANIITVRDHLSKITREFDNSQHHKKLATLMKNIIIWFYIKNNKSFPFPDTENLKIETAYSEKRAAVRIKDNSGGVYEINFNEMKEWDISKPTDKFPVIRKDLMKGKSYNCFLFDYPIFILVFYDTFFVVDSKLTVMNMQFDLINIDQNDTLFYLLTHYQTINFRLFQTDRVCRRQFQI